MSQEVGKVIFLTVCCSATDYQINLRLLWGFFFFICPPDYWCYHSHLISLSFSLIYKIWLLLGYLSHTWAPWTWRKAKNINLFVPLTHMTSWALRRSAESFSTHLDMTDGLCSMLAVDAENISTTWKHTFSSLFHVRWKYMMGSKTWVYRCIWFIFLTPFHSKNAV